MLEINTIGEIDPRDIWDAVQDRASEMIKEEAWEAVEYEVDLFVGQVIDDRENGRVTASDEVKSLLLDYTERREQGLSVCGLGEAFEEAVVQAMSGTDENPVTTANLRDDTVRQIVREEIRSAVSDIAHLFTHR